MRWLQGIFQRRYRVDYRCTMSHMLRRRLAQLGKSEWGTRLRSSADPSARRAIRRLRGRGNSFQTSSDRGTAAHGITFASAWANLSFARASRCHSLAYFTQEGDLQGGAATSLVGQHKSACGCDPRLMQRIGPQPQTPSMTQFLFNYLSTSIYVAGPSRRSPRASPEADP